MDSVKHDRNLKANVTLSATAHDGKRTASTKTLQNPQKTTMRCVAEGFTKALTMQFTPKTRGAELVKISQRVTERLLAATKSADKQ